MNKKTYPNQCPNCKKEDLVYGNIIDNVDEFICPYTCPHCGIKGEEIYKVEFVKSQEIK